MSKQVVKQVSRQVLRAATLAMAIAPTTLWATLPTLAQSRAPRNPAPVPQTAPSPEAAPPSLNSSQLSGCQNWAALALTNTPRSNIDVVAGQAAAEGIGNVQWRVRNGTDHGFCLVRRNGTVMEAVRYTNGAPLHYFPGGSGDLGTPIE